MRTVFILLAAIYGPLGLYGTGVAPEFTANIKVRGNYSVTFKAESFHFLHEPQTGWQHSYDGTDLQLFINYRINPFVRIAAGYQYGIEPSQSDTHRSIQQVSVLHRVNSWVLNHRLRTDQTFYDSRPTRYRIRYRLTADLPLQGKVIDPGEFYLNTSNELILALQNANIRYENRAVAQLGYAVNTQIRIQSGIDYRLFISNETSYNAWFKLGVFINI